MQNLYDSTVLIRTLLITVTMTMTLKTMHHWPMSAVNHSTAVVICYT